MDTLKELDAIYQSNFIPIIIVYNQALSNQKIENLDKFIKENFKQDFFLVSAFKENNIDNNPPINASNLGKLIEISILRAKEAERSSCYEFNFRKIKSEVQEIINKKKDNLIIILNNIIEEKIEIMSEGKTKEEFYDDLKNLLVYLISNHLYFDERKLVSLQTENLIKDFVKKIIDESIPKFDALFQKYIEDKSWELANKLYNYQNNYYESYLIDNKKSVDQFRNETRETLIEETSKKALLIFFKNLLKFICSLYIEKFKENSKNMYKQILEKEEFHNLIVKLIERDFEDISNKLIQ